MKHWKYLKYVIRHKWFVFWACVHYGIIWRGIVHDLSKFRPREWFAYAEYFYGGDRSKEMYDIMFDLDIPNFEFIPWGLLIQDKLEIAWNHHQHRNDHHWQYWVRLGDDGTELLIPLPDKCKKEMMADWIGAGKAIGKSKIWEWYEATKENRKLNPRTIKWVEEEIAYYKKEYESKERETAIRQHSVKS